jgi:hypothetical protein
MKHCQGHPAVLKQAKDASGAERRIVPFGCDTPSAQAGAKNLDIPLFTVDEVDLPWAVHRVPDAICVKVPE